MRVAGRGSLNPTPTDNRERRRNDRRSATGSQSVIGGRQKLEVAANAAPDQERRRRRRGNEGATGKQRLLVELGDEAVVIELLSVLMQPMMQLGAGGEGSQPHPQAEHESYDGHPARPELSGCCRSKHHTSLIGAEPRLQSKPDLELWGGAMEHLTKESMFCRQQ